LFPYTTLFRSHPLRALRGVVHDEQAVADSCRREAGPLVLHDEPVRGVGDSHLALLRDADDPGREGARQAARGFGEDVGDVDELLLDEGGSRDQGEPAGRRARSLPGARREGGGETCRKAARPGEGSHGAVTTSTTVAG